MKIPFYHVDAFANNVFSGNPAKVCVLDSWLPDASLQKIASENFLPATAFLVEQNDDYEIRWFTPEYEIDLCGHGSLAAAYVIFTFLEPKKTVVMLKYSGGELQVSNTDGVFTLHLPVKDFETFDSSLLIKGLGAAPKEIYQYQSERCLVVYDNENEVTQLKPDMSILRALDHRGIIVTAKSNQYDFVSRTFYPKKAASEDAVTGSSHCLLAPYWAKKLNKTKLHGYQASHRGGEIYCELQNDRVAISGKAVLYAQGFIIN